MTTKPYKIFASAFTENNLRAIFAEKVSSTKAVGRDGIKVNQFEANIDQSINIIHYKVTTGTYKFTKYKQKLISKGPYRNPRILSIPTIRDRLTLRALCNVLSAVYPNAILRKPHDYIREINSYLEVSPSSRYFLRIDVKDYYPNIDRDVLIKILKSKIRKKQIISLISNAIYNTTASDNDPGIPQGLSISNILAFIYLSEMDEIFQDKYAYFRYVDDILIICHSKASARKAFEDVSLTLQKKRMLSCHPLSEEGKSSITSIDKGVEYLGFLIQRNHIFVRSSSLKKMISNIVIQFTRRKYYKDDHRFLWLLNLRITGCIFRGKNYGWVFFFLPINNLMQLARLDNFVRKQFVAHNIKHLQHRSKKFIKTYNEIRYNFSATNYVPNFDNFTNDDMIATIVLLTETKRSELTSLSDNELHNIFYSIIKKEISHLEKDLMEFFS